MNLLHLLFSFKGRIKRLHWWVATLAVGGVATILITLLGFTAESAGYVMLDPDTQEPVPTGPFLLAMLGVVGVNAWINLAVSAKRLHDRNRTAWWLAAQVGVIFLSLLVTGVVMGAMPEQETLAAVLIGIGVLAAVGITLWLFIELGFLRGTQGPNRFGADPLGAIQADARL